MDDEIITSFKLLIIGESGVGKSSLLLRFVDDVFDPEQPATIVYDVSNRSSFDRLKHWLTELETYSTKSEVIKMLVANKIDKEKREVPKSDGVKFARQHCMLYIEASAKTKEGVQCAFEELVEKIMQTPDLWESDHCGFRLGQAAENSNSGYCGC